MPPGMVSLGHDDRRSAALEDGLDFAGLELAAEPGLPVFDLRADIDFEFGEDVLFRFFGSQNFTAWR